MAQAPKETEPAPVVPAGPTQEELLNAARMSEQRAVAAEGRAAYAENMARQAAQAMQQQPAPQQPQMVDPLIRYSQEDITMSPEDKRRSLAMAIDGRAQAAAARTEQRMEQRMEQVAFATESRNAINNVTMRRPELSDPRNSANFAAAMTKAKYEANAAGYEPSPTQLVIAAEKTYDEMFKTEKPPFTERSGAGASATPPEIGGKPQRNELESIYKMKAGMIQPAYDVSNIDEMNKLNNDYVGNRMKPMMKAGLNSDYANLINAALDPEGQG